MKHDERAVGENFGLRGKGWVFWTALIVIFALGLAGVLALALL